MSNILSKVLIFATGAAAGSVVTYAIVKRKYELLVQEEIDSYKDEMQYYTRPTSDDNSEEQDLAESSEDDPEAEVKEYESLMKKLGYNTVSDVPERYEKNEKPDENTDESDEEYPYGETENESLDPYVIPPDECGDCDYEIVSLMYYRDGVLAHLSGDVIDTIDELIGNESLNHFGEYEEDSVYVRNDSLQIDYVVLKDERDYWGVINGTDTN